MPVRDVLVKTVSKQLDIEYWGGLGWGYRCVLRAHYI